MTQRPILVTGAGGYVGGRLVPLLLASGYRVRAAARKPESLFRRPWSRHPDVEITAMDATDAASVQRAVTGCGVVYYLIHSMIASRETFAESDRRGAMNVSAAAADARVERIIYLGGLGDADDPKLSKHLRSRHEVEAIFRSGPVPATCLRAAMIMGSGSASFEMLRYLVERLPVMVTPRWVHTPCQPISIANVLGYLVGCLESAETKGRTFDIGGPEVVSYRELIVIFAEEAHLPRRIIVPVPVLSPKLSSMWIHLVTPVPAVIARPLAEGLSIPVVCRENDIRSLVPLRLQGCRETIRKALDRAAGAAADACELPEGHLLPPEWVYCGDADYAGGTTLEVSHRIVLSAAPEAAWRAVEAIGGAGGYYHAGLLWTLRGAVDRLAGGPGLKNARKDPHRLHEGEAFHFWRVASIDRPGRLVLESRMKAPGEAFMEVEVKASGEGSAVVLRSVFFPRGLAGLFYWFVLHPVHRYVFRGMLAGIADRCGACVIRGPERWFSRSETLDR